MKWVSSKIRNTQKKTNIRVEKTNLSFGEGKLGRGGGCGVEMGKSKGWCGLVLGNGVGGLLGGVDWHSAT